MTPSIGARSVACALLAFLPMTACGGPVETEGTSTTAATPSVARTTVTADTAPRPTPTVASTGPLAPTTPGGEGDDGELRVRLTVRGQRLEARLTESAAARDLLAQLPLTIEMTDHGAVEKTGPLPSPLSLDGQPDSADPAAGDLGYYAPGNDLVLYYGDQSYYPGIVVLGRMTGDAADRLAAMQGEVTTELRAEE